MKLSTKVRYATRFMITLAQRYGGDSVSLKDIVEKEGLSAKYLSQLVLDLKRAGMITSSRGNSGGYLLARSPADISVKDIYVAIEGEINLVDCQGICGDGNSLCVASSIWIGLSRVMSDYLADISLESLIVGKENLNFFI